MQFPHLFDIVVALDYHGNFIDGGGPYSYSLLVAGNTEVQYDAITWSDGRTKPSWSTISGPTWASFLSEYNATSAGYGDVTDLLNYMNGTLLPAKADSVHSHVQSDVTGLVTALSGKANSSHSHAQSEVTNLVSDLAGKAASSHTHSVGDITGLAIPKAYEGVTLRSGAFPVFKNATVGSGSAVMHFTSDGTSGGSALFASGPILDSVNMIVSDATASYQMSWAWSNSNKTLTITANKLTTANILTGILGQAQANSSVIKVCVWGY